MKLFGIRLNVKTNLDVVGCGAVCFYGLLIGNCLRLGHWSLDCIKAKCSSISQLNTKPSPLIFQTITGPRPFWDSYAVQKPAKLTDLTQPPERVQYVGIYGLGEALV